MFVCCRYDKKMPKKTQDQTQYQASLHKVTNQGHISRYVIYRLCESIECPFAACSTIEELYEATSSK